MPARARTPLTLLGGTARGAALGALVTTLVCAAIAAQSIHLGFRILDWGAGVLLVAVPLVVVVLALGILTRPLAWLLDRARKRGGARPAALVATLVGTLRFLGRPLFGTTLGIVLLLWASPTDGPLSMFHSLFYLEIPIVAGAVVGGLAGLGLEARTIADGRPGGRRAARLTLASAATLAISFAAWAVLPGAGDPIVREPADATGSIESLALADPSLPGPYAVLDASYGSGTDARRPAYGADVDWRTPTVDLSDALPPRDPMATTYEDWFWGFDTASVPLNALVWYPADAPGRRPVVVIAHGNHDAGQYSEPGYAYLGRHLASRGYVVASIDMNFLNGDAFFDYSGAEIGARAWLMLRHVDQLRAWGETHGHPLGGRVDTARVALIGHSRGGEAAALAASVATGGGRPQLANLSDIPRGLAIRAVVAFAPSDGMYSGPGAPIRLSDVDYAVIQGAYDGDLPGYSGLKTYHRVTFTPGSGHLKVAVFSGRANHGRFNSIWNDGDAGSLSSWLLDRGSVLASDQQQRLAESTVAAFLARSLDGLTGYDAFFREPRGGRAWLPDDVVETHWQSSDRVIVDDYDTVATDEERSRGTGFERIGRRDPALRDGGPQGDLALALRWSRAAAYTVPVDPSLAAAIEPGGSLVFSMAPARDGPQPIDPVVELTLTDGRKVSVRLETVAPIRPPLPARVWKVEELGRRYLPSEVRTGDAERFLQTLDVPLAAFSAAAQGLEPGDVRAVTFRFTGAGEVFLDDVAFEPPVGG